MLNKNEVKIMEKEIENILNKCDTCNLKECINCEISYTEIQRIKDYIERLESKLKQAEIDKQKLIEYLENDMKINIERVKNYEKMIQNSPEATDRKSWLRTKTIVLTTWETERSMLAMLKGENDE